MTTTFDATKVEAFGCETAPLATYVNTSRKIASEYVLKYAGKKRRVYSGTNRPLFIIVNGLETILPDEVANMFLYATYAKMTPVAQSVKVAA